MLEFYSVQIKEKNMLYHDHKFSIRIQEQILNEAKQRKKELIEKRKKPISLSGYLRELIALDTDKKILK